MLRMIPVAAVASNRWYARSNCTRSDLQGTIVVAKRLSGIDGAGRVAAALALCSRLPARADPDAAQAASRRRVAVARPIGAFTPAAADPRLAALLARSGIGRNGVPLHARRLRRGDAAAR